MTPYWGTNFFQFIGVFFHRLCQFMTGGSFELAADELQIAVLGLTAISCGLIGPFLVLKRMSMFANSLSHTILLGVVGAFLIASSLWGGALTDLSTLFLGALIAALLTAFFTELLVRLFRLQEDASVGLVFTALFAIGVILVTIYTRNIHLSSEAVMGNADALQVGDIHLSGLLAIMNGVAVALFYRRLQICSFDGHLAKTLGIRQGFYQFLLLFLAAATIIGAFRAVGVLLVLAFLVGPYLTARLFSNRLSWLLLWSPLIGVFASFIGVAISRHSLSVWGLPLSTGGLSVCTIGAIYFIGVIIKKSGKRSPLIKQRADQKN